MQAVILAGGLGTRLRPLTYSRPKALLPVLNRPLILHILDALPPQVDEVLLAASFMVEALEAFFAARPGKPPVTVVSEEEPLGTGGALKNLEDRLEGSFLTFNVDVISSLDPAELVAFRRARGGVGALALWEVEDPTPYGVVGLDRDGRIERFQEKPAPEEAFSRLVNAGVYVLQPEILDLVPAGRPVSLEREVFPRAIPLGLYGMEFEGHWSDAGTLESYLEANRTLLAVRGGRVEEGAVVRPGAGVLEPVLVGGSSVVEGGIVGPFVSLGRRCLVTRAKVSNAVLLDGVTVGEGAIVEGSVLGAGATVGPGCRLEGCVVADEAFAEPGSKLLGVRLTR